MLTIKCIKIQLLLHLALIKFTQMFILNKQSFIAIKKSIFTNFEIFGQEELECCPQLVSLGPVDNLLFETSLFHDFFFLIYLQI